MKNKLYFPALTGIRYIAAFMVCLFHSNPFTENRFGSVVHNFFNEFHVGVTFFFVLSGFLITIRYYQEKHINFKKYFINRFARIYPVYFILTTLVMLWSFFANNEDFLHFIKVYLLNITFLRGFFDDYKFTGILQGWSLTVEETFYLVAPLSFLLIRNNKWHILSLSVGFTLLGVILVMLFKDAPVLHGFFNSYTFLFSYTFFGRALEFFAGIALALLYLSRPDGTHNAKYPVYTILGIFFSTLCIYLISIQKTGDLTHGIKHSNGMLINNTMLPIFGVAPLYYGLITEKSLLSGVLSNRYFQILGKSSFALYLIHLLILKINSNFIFLIIVSTVASLFIYYYIEEPLNKKIRALAK